MIRIAIVDDHHAIRLGVESAVRAESDLIAVGTASNGAELTPMLYSTHPDVVLLDYKLPDADGLTLCRQVKSDVLAPAVIVYSAFADDSMTVPAIVAGADGLLHKGGSPRELFEAIRQVAGGGTALPPVSHAQLEAAGQALDGEDLPVLGMLVSRTPPDEISATLGLRPEELKHRIMRMLSRLKAPVHDQVA
jgi:DNA-binding NarL/FixJ family response regulator